MTPERGRPRGSGAAGGQRRDAPREDPADATAAGRSGSGPGSGQVFYCDLCGHPMLNLHCKLTCERCGYKRDCSDP